MRENSTSRLAVSWTRPRPTRCTDTTRPSTGVFEGRTGIPLQVMGSKSTPRTVDCFLALYEETGWVNRTQNEVPAGNSVQARATECSDNTVRKHRSARNGLKFLRRAGIARSNPTNFEGTKIVWEI